MGNLTICLQLIIFSYSVLGILINVIPHGADSISSHFSVHHQRAVRAGDAVPRAAAARAAEGRALPAAGAAGLRPLRQRESRTGQSFTLP